MNERCVHFVKTCDVKIWRQTSRFYGGSQIDIFQGVIFRAQDGFDTIVWDFIGTKVCKCILMEGFGSLLCEYRAYMVLFE